MHENSKIVRSRYLFLVEPVTKEDQDAVEKESESEKKIEFIMNEIGSLKDSMANMKNDIVKEIMKSLKKRDKE